MKELLLLRHAKAKLLEQDMEDKDRVLRKRGKQDAHNIAQWLKMYQLFPDVLLTSPAMRTLETAQIIHEVLDLKDVDIEKNEQLYATNVEQLLAVLNTHSEEKKRILLVGHNPELENLLIYLVGKEALPTDKKLLSTSTLVRLSIENVLWSELKNKCAQLLSITYAKSLK